MTSLKIGDTVEDKWKVKGSPGFFLVFNAEQPLLDKNIVEVYENTRSN